jgi:hypothetical protein
MALTEMQAATCSRPNAITAVTEGGASQVLNTLIPFCYCCSCPHTCVQVKLHLLVTDLGSDLLNSLFSTLLNAIK